MKAQHTLRSTSVLTRNVTLFALLTMGFLPALQAQSNQPVTGNMAQAPMTTPAPVAPPRATYVAPTQPVAPPQAAAYVEPPVAPVAAAAVQEPAPAPTPVAEQAIPRTRVGDVTRTLLQAQADGRVAAPRLPMLGAAADASYQRYLESFKHPLPEFFENKVAKSASN
ncbi:DUF3613 domain-containing protein [Glaciimonas sp. PCH181]|uniref:DUF3613 domain-containing protein n=1 Tax=Glaciimonas sp. PCH181 TaxID=2133943 RepID=UPI000D396E3C|nr:DUF3613 domain-containing protein [Glaciimonas sp. PCH181]PUA19805.1 DUF3613 domain-containing protein [Glaciimonas sp. PCH181]